MIKYTVKLTNEEKIVVTAEGYDVHHDNMAYFYITRNARKVREWRFSLFNVLYIREEQSQ